MNEYKDFVNHLDLLFKVKYHGDDIAPVKIFNIQKETDTVYIFKVESTYGANEECYEVYYKGVPFEAKLSVIDSDEQSITLKAEL
jgi:hypothetical protein